MVVHVVVDHIVQETNGQLGAIGQLLEVEAAVVAHELGQIQVAQIAGRVRGQRLFATGVGAHQRVGVFDIVVLLHGVPEDDPRLSRRVGIGDDPVPQIPGAHRAEHLASKAQIEIRVTEHGLHELVGYQHRYIGVLYLGATGVVLDRDEVFDIRMIDPQSEHQGSAPARLRHGVGALGEQVHESRASGRLIHRGVDRRPLGPQHRQVRAHAPAGAVHHGRLAQTPIDPLHAILYDRNDIAVGKGGLAARFIPTGPVHHPTTGNELEIEQQREELIVPVLPVSLDSRDRPRDPVPHVQRAGLARSQIFVAQHIDGQLVFFVVGRGIGGQGQQFVAAVALESAIFELRQQFFQTVDARRCVRGFGGLIESV